MVIAIVIVWALVLGISPGLAVIAVAATILLLDLHDLRSSIGSHARDAR